MFKRLRTIVLTVLMVLGLLPVSAVSVHAEEITSVSATTDISSILANGKELQTLTFTKSGSDDIVIESAESGYWLKYRDGEWKEVASGTFTPGSWKYNVPLTVNDLSDDRIAESMTLTVDGTAWEAETGVETDTVEIGGADHQYWYMWFLSPEFTVADTGELTFNAELDWDYIQSTAGQPIIPFNVSSGAAGGTTPYTFSKTSGPDWITVASDGTVSGTPTAADTNPDLVIRVTDNDGNYKEITLIVDYTAEGSSTDKVSYVTGTTSVGTGDLSDIIVFGKTIPTVSITCDPAEGNPTIGDIQWMQYNGLNWNPVGSDPWFYSHSYALQATVRINAPDSETYTFPDDFLLIINDVLWDTVEIVNDPSGCYAIMRSPAIEVLDPRTEVEEIHAQSPVFDNIEDAAHWDPQTGDPVFAAQLSIVDPEAVTISGGSSGWERLTKSKGWSNTTVGTVFEPGRYKYSVQLRIENENAKDYVLARFPKFINNGREWNQEESYGANPEYSYTFFYSHEFVFPIRRVQINGVTPPSEGAIPTTLGITDDVKETIIDSASTLWAVKNDAGEWVLHDGSAFEAGKEYAIQVRLMPDEEYYAEFADPTNVFVNGKPAVVSPDSEGCITVIMPMDFVSVSSDLYVVTANSLNVRAGASADSKRIGGLKYGDVVQAKAVSGKWILIDYEGQDGWINSDYLALTYTKETAISPENVTITAGALNVREAPSTEATRIGGVKADDVVLVTGVTKDSENNEWLVIDYKGQLGFIMAKYTTGVSAEISEDYSDLKIIEMPDDFLDKLSIDFTKISEGNSLRVGEADYMKNSDGTITIGFFPDDAVNLRNLDKDHVTLPEGSAYEVTDVTFNANGSISLKLGPAGGVKYPVWFNGEQITSLNCDDVYHDGGTVKYDPATKTLTLDNPVLKKDIPTSAKALIVIDGIEVTITGKAVFDSHFQNNHGINLDNNGKVIFDGADIVFDDPSMVIAGNDGSSKVTVRNSTVKALGTNYCGVYADYVAVESGTLTAKGTEYGILALKGFEIDGGTVDTTGIHVYGGDLTVNGGTVTGGPLDAGHEYDEVKGNIIINGGTVRADASKNVWGYDFGIRAYGKIEIGPGITAVIAEAKYAILGFNGITIDSGDEIIEPVPSFMTSGPPSYGIWITISRSIMTSDTASKVVIVPKGSLVVEFDAQGHGTEPDPVYVKSGEKVTEPEALSEKGYTFQGWYTDEDCTNKYDFSSPVTEKLTLYAKWLVNVDGFMMYTDGTEADGSYYKVKTTTVKPLFEKGSGEVSIEVGHLCTDSACSDAITSAPEAETTYYFRVYLKDPSSFDTGRQKIMFLSKIKDTIISSAVEAEMKFISMTGNEDGDAAELLFEYTPDVITYTFSKGADATWTKGSTKGVDYTVNRNVHDNKTFERFETISMDGSVVDAANYEASSGSLNATLKPAYLETLSAGTHKVKFTFRDGSAETTLKITAPAPGGGSSDGGTSPNAGGRQALPDTGDHSNLPLWGIICAVSLAALAGLLFIRRRWDTE